MRSGDPTFSTSEVEDLDWKSKIESALKTALELGRLEEIKDRQDSLIAGFLAGEITGSEFDETEEELDIKAGTIVIHQALDFASCLKAYGLSDEEASEHVEHEQAHFDAALAKGLDPYFQVQFAWRRGDEGQRRYSFFPSTNFKFPAGMPDDTRRNILREVIEAPDDLSPRDISQLGERS